MVALVKLQQSFRAGSEASQGLCMMALCCYLEFNVRKIAIFVKISNYMLLCKVVAMVILHKILSAGHLSNVA